MPRLLLGALAPAAALLAVLGARPGWADVTPARSVAPAGAAVYFISPADGAVVKSPVTVRFGLAGMSVVPAGIAREETGHHHLIVDSPLPDLSLPIPSDAHHYHFGGGRPKRAWTSARAHTHCSSLWATQAMYPTSPRSSPSRSRSL